MYIIASKLLCREEFLNNVLHLFLNAIFYHKNIIWPLSTSDSSTFYNFKLSHAIQCFNMWIIT